MTSKMVWSQCSYTISGKIVYESTKENACFSEVIVKETNQGAVANANGFYEIKNVCEGEYTLICRHLAYVTQEVKIAIKSNVVQSFELVQSSTELDHVHIEHIHEKQESSVQVQTLEGSKLDQARSMNLGETMKKFSGVYTFNTGNSISKPVLHGMHSKRLLIFNNGIRQEGQQWGAEHAPEIDPFNVKKITVVKGANSVRYGADAMAGVILVDPSPIIVSGVRSDLFLLGNSNGWGGGIGGLVEGNFKKMKHLSFRIQGTYKRRGDVSAPNYVMSNTGLQEYSVSGGLGYYKDKVGAEVYYSLFKSEIAILSASHFGNLTDLNNAIASNKPLIIRDFTYNIDRPKQDIIHHLVKGKFYYFPNEKNKLELNIAFQENNRKEYDSHNPYGVPNELLLPRMQFILQTFTGDLNWDHQFHSKLKGNIGVQTLYQTNRRNGAFFIPNFKNTMIGFYWIENLKLKKWDVEFGARYDINFLESFFFQSGSTTSIPLFFHSPSANFGVIYHPSEHVNFRTNIGTAWRPPHVSELYSKGLHHGSASIETGDANLKKENAYNINFSFQLKYERFKLEATAYYYFIVNYIYLQPTLQPVLTIRGAFPAFEYNSGDVDIKGIDVDMEAAITKRLKFNSKTSLLWAWNYTENNHVIYMPPFRFNNDLTYEFKNTKVLKSPYISLETTVVTEQVNAPQGIDYAPAPPAYFLLGASMGTTFQISSKQTIEVSISATNILNTEYRDYLNRFRYFSHEMGRNISLKIKIPMQFINY